MPTAQVILKTHNIPHKGEVCYDGSHAIRIQTQMRVPAEQPQTASEALRAARALINTPDRWNRGSLHRYHKVNCRTEVVGSCLIGSVDIASYCGFPTDDTFEIWSDMRHRALDFLREVLKGRNSGGAYVSAFNDDPDTTHLDIMELFADAIHLAEMAENGGKPMPPEFD